MSKKSTIPTFETCTKPTRKYIMGRNYLIQEMQKKMNNFKFKDFDGDYNHFLKIQRQFQYKIDGYKADIKKALLLDSDETIIAGELY